MIKLLSAIMVSPWLNGNLSRPDLIVISVSDMPPAYNCETIVTLGNANETLESCLAFFSWSMSDYA